MLDIETQDGHWVFVDTNTGEEMTEQMSTQEAIETIRVNSERMFDEWRKNDERNKRCA